MTSNIELLQVIEDLTIEVDCLRHEIAHQDRLKLLFAPMVDLRITDHCWLGYWLAAHHNAIAYREQLDVTTTRLRAVKLQYTYGLEGESE